LGAIAMDAYWINLDNRKDRASQCLNQLSENGIKGFRVPAVSRSEVGIVQDTENQHYFQGIIACRMSHMKALNLFLSSNEDFGLILEDDFMFSVNLNNKELLSFQGLMRIKNISLLQIGFLPKCISLPTFFSNLVSISSNIRESISLYLQPNVPSKRIIAGFLPGAHAYIVSREMASYLLNNAELDLKIPVDLWLNALTKMEKREDITVSRLRFSIVSQNRSFKSDLQF
jgi:GR25 family glycosyltransferase involved in LPS biosynthesis